MGDIRCALQELISFPTLMMFLMDYSFVLRASYFFAVLSALAAHSARKCMQAACIRQHSASTVHRMAENHFLCPDRNVSELAPYNLQEQDLYRGNVPQARDWLRAWNSCQTAASFNKAQKHYETEDYAAGRPCSVSRKNILFPQYRCKFYIGKCERISF